MFKRPFVVGLLGVCIIGGFVDLLDVLHPYCGSFCRAYYWMFMRPCHR